MPDDSRADVLDLHDVRPEDRRTQDLLEDVVARLGRIEAALSDRATVAPVSRIDKHLHAALAPEICAAVGDAAWTVRELLGHARSDAELLKVFDDAIGLDEGTARRLGRFLARVEGFALDGYTVHREGDARAGASWRVVRVSVARPRVD